MRPEEEKALIAGVQQDLQRFSLVYDQYYPAIFRYIFRRLGDYDLAADVTAETFIKAYLGIGKFRWKDISLSAWLYRIATNETNMVFRKRKYQPLYLSQIPDYRNLVAADGKAEAEIELQRNEDFITIQKCLKRLAPKYQEVIALRYFEERSLKEIAGILNKKEGTVKSLLSRGMDRLKILVVECNEMESSALYIKTSTP